MVADNRDGTGAAVVSQPPLEPETPDEADLSMPGPKARFLAVLVLLAGVIALAVHTRGYSAEAREFPLLTLAVMAGLLVLQGAVTISELRRRSSSDAQAPSEVTPWRKDLQLAGWIVLLGVMVSVLGLMVGVVDFLAIYLVAVRAARLRSIAVIVVLSAAGLYGLFVVFLQVRLPDGLLL